MKIPNKRQLQQIAYNHLSDIYLQESVNLYKKCTAKPNYFFIDYYYSGIRYMYVLQMKKFYLLIKAK